MVVLLAALGGQGLALASVQGSVAGSQTVTTGTFAVVPTTAAGTPPPGALTLTWTTLALGPQYFDVVNTGTLALTATSYGVAVSGGGTGSPSISLAACVGGTWTLGICSTTAAGTALGSWTSAASTPVSNAAAPTAVGSRLSIKASLTGLITASAVAVVTTAVSSGSTRQVRAASTTSS